MGKAKLSVEETRAMLLHVAQGVVASAAALTKADQAIGDGDHGVGMSRGFEAVAAKLGGQSFRSVGALLKEVGTTLMTSIGGAAGAVFGTLFRSGGDALIQTSAFDSQALARFLEAGLAAVKKRGGAQAGDKTMIDALEPASLAAHRTRTAPLDQALTAVAEAAREGVERTNAMVARVGKATPLGERAVGHPDPGAVSTWLILNLMAEYAGTDPAAE